jgi:hypothetical protein
MEDTIATEAVGFETGSDDGNGFAVLTGATGGTDEALISLLFMLTNIRSITLYTNLFSLHVLTYFTTLARNALSS